MKAILIIPPITSPSQYHLAAPLLAGQLTQNAQEALCIDANLGFFNHILTSKNIKDSVQYLNNKYNKLHNKFKNILYVAQLRKIEDIEDYKEYKNLCTLFQPGEEADLVRNCHKYVKSAINTYKDKESFYNIMLLNRAFNILNLSSQILSYRYPNFQFSFHGTAKYDEKLLNLKYFDKHINSEFVFDEYYKTLIKEIKKKQPDLTGISISYEEQVIPSLKLAYLLKKHTKTKVVLGGSHISRVIDDLPNKQLLFEKYCDFVINGNGEESIIELAQYMNKKLDITQVSNLIYKDKNKIITNEYKTVVAANNVKPAIFNGIEIDKYFSPEIVAPFQLSKGCYWGKCTFCTHTLENKYSVKNMSTIIEELKSLHEIGITKFTIIDEAVSPSLLNKFADALIENKLDIKYMIDARFEEGFTSELFKKAYASGLRFILWGYETGNERIHTLMNKDVCFSNRKNILKAAAENNIFNHLFVFHGFPTATVDEEIETLKFIEDNNSIIGSFVTGAFFVLTVNSEIEKHPENFGITDIKKDQRADFSNSLAFDGNSLSQKDKDHISNLSTQIRKNKFNYYAPLYIRENLLLYLSRYDNSQFKTTFSRGSNKSSFI